MRLKYVLFLGSTLALAGCHQQTPADKVAAMPQQTFHMRGKIVDTDPSRGEITVDHQAIPGFMDAMTMPYKLAQPETISEMHKGDMITADLLVRKDAAGFRAPTLAHIVVVGQARPDTLPAVQYNVPQAGQDVPDFHLLNQSGKTIDLAQYKGKALLLTFVYTRCPLADFCPRMSNNFAQIDQSLASDPELYKNTHLLSISFDPAYDTPAVLKSYGGAHTGKFTKETFQHWEFAAPAAADLLKVEQFFNVGVTPGGDPAKLSHSLSTVLIGKDGKIVAWHPSNDWKPEDVLAEVKQAAK
ncbi:protein SCO1/2 [Granulicella rosea]|uniref:Protein SCO1/2 n=1 Tax=Granulicella rosea TaxID=474952 RepID=A0A239EUE2_9BACT|nr:SCO family protein [Granulicella rosea]SNS48275.1 protein SCO1/2 [Granulicella rosea]